jgi:hypothetical protein
MAAIATPMNWETIIDFLKALLTPAIAILTAYIAFAQYRLAKAKHRFELYERRSAVYKAAMKFIAQVTSGGNASLEDSRTFLRDTSEAGFLFKKSKAKQIQAFLDSLYKKSVDLYTTNEQLNSNRGTPDNQREERANKMHDLLIWFGKQFDECRKLFASELSLV